jgi:beta-glucosidase
MSIYKFPDSFKWGSATSAHQIEGNNHNDWSEWETSPKRLEQLKKEGKDPVNFISGRACDSYNRYEEDFDIAKQLNQNIHRFSIEWSRIEPEEGKFNEKEIQHYVDIVKALRDRGIEPMITLWHFTNPIWFAKKGGWLNKTSPDLFIKFIKVIVPPLKAQNVKLWITFNEATTVWSGFSYLTGRWPPQDRSIFKWRRVNKNIIKAHIKAYKEIKKIYGDSPSKSLEVEPPKEVQPQDQDPSPTSHNVEVGLVESNTYSIGGNNFYEKIIGKIYNYYRNLYFWTKAFPYYDFIGVNYYHIDRRVPGCYKTLPKQNWFMEEMGWEIYSKGIYYVLSQLKRFKKPIYITENGTADARDLIREKYIKEHLKWVWQATQEDVDIRGYLYWSLLDNFEWHHGYVPRFGLVEVDFNPSADEKRHIRPSAYEYAKICKENTLEY